MTDFFPTSASSDASPPTSSCYWVVPQLLLAGAYPGHPDPDEHHATVQSLVGAGIRAFISLMEPDEADHAGDPFVPYADLARQFCPEIVCVRHPIRDVSVPTKAEMFEILDEIDRHMEARRPVYVHCWGGVGRTGTVIGCWLIRHKLAEPSNVLDVLMRLRRQDRDRRGRMSPETVAQQRFVKAWQEVVVSNKEQGI